MIKYIKRIDVFDSDEDDIKNLLKFCKTYNRDYLKLIYIYFGESDYSYQTSNCIPLKNFEHLSDGTLILHKNNLTNDENKKS